MGRRRLAPYRLMICAAPFVIALAASAHAETQSPHSRFDFCATPLPPSCVAALSHDKRRLSECERETERYVAMVFSYRACLTSEMERAVSEANDAIRAVRCARDGRFCVKGAAPPAPAR